MALMSPTYPKQTSSQRIRKLQIMRLASGEGKRADHVRCCLSSALKTLNLSVLDKVAGGVLGAAKNTLMVLVVLSISAPLLVQLPQWQTSVLAPELMPYAPMGKELATDMLGMAWGQINQS